MACADRKNHPLTLQVGRWRVASPRRVRCLSHEALREVRRGSVWGGCTGGTGCRGLLETPGVACEKVSFVALKLYQASTDP